MGRKIGTGGEPQYLVRWRGYTEADDSWEPWAQLLSCLIGMKAFHKGQFAAGTAPLGYAPGCPSREQAHGSDPDLAGWRISSKRTPSGREYRVYYGPLGEHVRARNIALTLAALYDLPADLPRVPTPPPTIGAPTANGHANAAAAIAQVDLAGAAASAAAIKASIAAAAANSAGANTAANTAANAAANTAAAGASVAGGAAASAIGAQGVAKAGGKVAAGGARGGCGRGGAGGAGAPTAAIPSPSATPPLASTCAVPTAVVAQAIHLPEGHGAQQASGGSSGASAAEMPIVQVVPLMPGTLSPMPAAAEVADAPMAEAAATEPRVNGGGAAEGAPAAASSGGGTTSAGAGWPYGKGTVVDASALADALFQ